MSARQNNRIEWQASWIESEICGGPRTAAPAPYFRRAFTLPAKPCEAKLHITALGLYETSVNGKLAHDTVFTPGWTIYDKRVRYQNWDVTALLRKGQNTLGVILGDGWYCGHVGTNNRQNYGDRPKLLAQLEWVAADGQRGLLTTDAEWRWSTGPILENDLIMGEAHDARRESAGWDAPGFDDSGWRTACVAEVPEIEIEPHYGSFVRRQEHLPGRSLPLPCGDTRRGLFDLGQNISGRVRIAVKGPRGSTLRIRHAEMMDEYGHIYTENLRSARATDYYTLKGDGTEVWEPRFTFHGFRYVETYWTVPGEAGAVESVEGVVLHADMPRTGDFECSHSLLNQLYKNTIWGQKGNFLEVPTDCPQRDERLGWTADAQVFCRTSAFNMDVSDFFRKWLKDIRDNQYPGGGIPSHIPFMSCWGFNPDGGPAWADAALICPMELYRAYGDPDFIADHYDCMVGYMDYLAANKVKDGIRNHPGFNAWSYGDWLALDCSGRVDGGTPKDLIGTAFYANNARILAECAGLLGKKSDRRRWETLRRETAKAFRNRYVSPDGLMVSGTQTACVLALHFDLLTPAQRPATVTQLVSLIEQNGMKIGTGFVGTPYILHVLEAAGRLDIAYQLLEQEEFPSWLFPVKNGATTIWERWDGWTSEKGFQDKGMNSFNHYAYGAVCDWLVGSVAGIEPAEPGYRRIRFKPRPGGSLTRASASLETRHGKAAIVWTLKQDKLRLRLMVPPGATAALDLTGEWKTDAVEFTGGTHITVAVRKNAHSLGGRSRCVAAGPDPSRRSARRRMRRTTASASKPSLP